MYEGVAKPRRREKRSKTKHILNPISFSSLLLFYLFYPRNEMLSWVAFSHSNNGNSPPLNPLSAFVGERQREVSN
nr:hypothetical protein Itr_chr03CG20170 [Ipomoea trifida]